MKDKISNIIKNEENTYEDRNFAMNVYYFDIYAGYKAIKRLKEEFKKINFSNNKCPEEKKMKILEKVQTALTQCEDDYYTMEEWELLLMERIIHYFDEFEIDTESKAVFVSDLDIDNSEDVPKILKIYSNSLTCTEEIIEDLKINCNEILCDLKNYICSREVNQGYMEICKTIFENKIPDEILNKEDYEMALYFIIHSYLFSLCCWC